MLSQKLQDYEEDLKALADVITIATVEVYKNVSAKLLPTPAKLHYVFNLRDVSRVFSGMMRITKMYHDSKIILCRLWIHECFRVFHDRLINEKDREIFVSILTEKLGTVFDLTYHNICKDKIPPVFCDFMNKDKIYEDQSNFTLLRQHLKEQLNEYNKLHRNIYMDLVLFKNTIEHVSRIVRVVSRPRGNMLLIGIGGSGKKSSAKFAAFLCSYNIFYFDVKKNYTLENFREDIKEVYKQAILSNKKILVLLMENAIGEDSFMEDVNNLLTCEDVSDFFSQAELQQATTLLEDKSKESYNFVGQSFHSFIMDRLHNNLHILLGMSPIGKRFRNRMRMYPSLINLAIIDWFGDWPPEAYLEIAEKYIDDWQFYDEHELKPSLAKMFAYMFSSVSLFAQKSKDEFRINIYVTPTVYFESMECYKT
ncbi:hypothetical protein HELRODRAFT_67238 [Helobdella robusta]|uniref:Dynein heavy chain AAA module D4 domain-containing protein n=1 Tax=Helobdella robusta TaxID=6412 RepID=T1FYY6_HELRO|nr:hypothetical protein HELRODRAFT_67238 [Helobdella robusta]ESN99365.1 hypothetical protein HELRODRAFT_67238 [Helobdella robusta]